MTTWVDELTIMYSNFGECLDKCKQLDCATFEYNDNHRCIIMKGDCTWKHNHLETAKYVNENECGEKRNFYRFIPAVWDM